MLRRATLAQKIDERLRYEEGIAACSRSLIEGGPQAISEALHALREAAGASRVYIFENFASPAGELRMRQICESCAPGVPSEVDNPMLHDLPYSTYGASRQLMAEGKPVWGIVRNLDAGMQAVLSPQGVVSILHIPVNVAGEWYGFIGFDDTVSPREWTEEDIRLLRTAAEMIGAHIARERAVGQLEKGKAKLDKIFLTVPCGIGMVIDRVFTEVNERLCRITGYPAAELLGRNARILYDNDAEYDRVSVETLAKIRRDGTGATETRWKRKDGSMVDILLSSSPIEPGNFTADFLFAVLDITERANAERRRRIVEAQMQHVQRLESLGVLAGGIAHDYNNLLMVVLGNLELVTSEPGLPQTARRSLKEIDAAARHGAELTRQLLAYAGRGRLVVQRLDVSAVIDEMRDIVEVSVSKRAAVEYELPPGLPYVESDVTQIRQVVMNLLTNAAESFEGTMGRIIVRTGTEALDTPALQERILGSAATPGSYVFIEVSDNGSGIDGHTMENMFEPFYSTKFFGRGLGLPAVHGIVRAHRGCILVESAPQKGSRFRVSFPAV